ncbi:hypothetical protein ACT453_60850, partial [Bacillus sp. D-CC]
SVKLPKTNLLAVMSDKGYIMCGALDEAREDMIIASEKRKYWVSAIIVAALYFRSLILLNSAFSRIMEIYYSPIK